MKDTAIKVTLKDSFTGEGLFTCGKGVLGSNGFTFALDEK